MANTALNRTSGALLTNKSGGALNYGDVVVLDNTNTNGFTTTTTSGLDTRGLGVIGEPNGIANNATGFVVTAGWCPQVNLNTAATVGQFIKTHTVAGQATPHSSPQVGGDFGVVLAATATPPAILFGSAHPSSVGTVTNTGTLTSGTLIQGNGTTDITVNATTATVTKLTSGVPSAATASTDYLAPAAWMVCGRLTTESGVPVSTSDRTAQGTIYWTPYNGDTVPLYTGSAWIRLAFSEISLALSGLTSGKNYDVFVYNNSGTLTLELSAAWSSDTARTDALALQNGLYVKSGTTTRLWVGTIRTTSTTTTEDSGGGSTTQVGGKRFVWNAFNQVPRWLRVIDTADSWAYTTDTWRVADGATAPANCVEWVVGVAAALLTADVRASVNVNAGGAQIAKVGIGLGNTTPVGLWTAGYNGAATNTYFPVNASYRGTPGLGYSSACWLEKGAASGSTFQGDGGALNVQSGLEAWLLN